MAVSGEETQIARGENIELETITVTVHFRITTVSTTATTETRETRKDFFVMSKILTILPAHVVMKLQV